MPPKAEQLETLEFNKEDIYIPVMGVTGAGKSSFIAQCCPWVSEIVSSGLSSFTSDCALYSLKFKGHRVHLIDTPGFNDTHRTDTEVLRQVATWLAEAYRIDTKVNGIIYFHGIHESRMKGSDMMNLRVFKRVSGLDNMKSVVLATSFWDQTELAVGEEREKALKEKPAFWKGMIEHGAQAMRFLNNAASAYHILEYLVDKNTKTILQIQQEMSEGISLRDTSAGRELDKEIREQIERVEAQMRDEMAAMEQALREQNEQEIEESQRAQDRLMNQITELQDRQKQLDANTEQLLREKDEQIKNYQRDIQQVTSSIDQMRFQHDQAMVQLQNEASSQRDQIARMERQRDKMTAKLERADERHQKALAKSLKQHKRQMQRQENQEYEHCPREVVYYGSGHSEAPREERGVSRGKVAAGSAAGIGLAAAVVGAAAACSVM